MDYDYPDFLLEAAKVSDANWTYFMCWTSFDKELMDKWLVNVNHPLAYEPGTNERQFKTLMKEIKGKSNDKDSRIP